MKKRRIHLFVVPKPKPEPPTSWWVGKSREEFAAEVVLQRARIALTPIQIPTARNSDGRA